MFLHPHKVQLAHFLYMQVRDFIIQLKLIAVCTIATHTIYLTNSLAIIIVAKEVNCVDMNEWYLKFTERNHSICHCLLIRVETDKKVGYHM